MAQMTALVALPFEIQRPGMTAARSLCHARRMAGAEPAGERAGRPRRHAAGRTEETV